MEIVTSQNLLLLLAGYGAGALGGQLRSLWLRRRRHLPAQYIPEMWDPVTLKMMGDTIQISKLESLGSLPVDPTEANAQPFSRMVRLNNLSAGTTGLVQRLPVSPPVNPDSTPKDS